MLSAAWQMQTPERRHAPAQVILVVPWLALSDQALIFPNQRTFERPAEQEECMREWIKKRTSLAPDFEIVWYPGAALCSTHGHDHSGAE